MKTIRIIFLLIGGVFCIIGILIIGFLDFLVIGGVSLVLGLILVFIGLVGKNFEFIAKDFKFINEK